jgi:hypothetical protein
VAALRPLAASLLIASLAVQPAEAGKVARLIDSGLRAGDKLVRGMTASDAGKTIALRKGGALKLGALVGKGFYGAVYHLDPASRALVPEHDGPIAVKLPHGWRYSPLRALKRWVTGKHEDVAQASFITKARLRAEIATRKFLDDHVALAESSPLYPADPAWGKGTVPVVPILRVLEARRGQAVLKPFVRGLALGEILARPGGFTPAMERSLRELYDFVQAMHDGVRVRAGSGFGQLQLARPGKGAGLSLDARPANLMWVEDAQTMASLGLRRPSFVFVELDQAFGNVGQYLAKRTSFADYRDEVLRSARAER